MTNSPAILSDEQMSVCTGGQWGVRPLPTMWDIIFNWGVAVLEAPTLTWHDSYPECTPYGDPQ
ncbi:MAG TPA: hypothetical protein VFV50_18975 [Bdellovibrionales bacterium]|nr:hypothetical protein [Bdellovibrionales bacterium]